MDTSISDWVRRGVGFGAGLLIIGTVAVAAIGGSKVIAMVFITILFGSALRPVVDVLRSRMPFGRTVATGVVFLGVALLLVGLGVILVSTAISQIGEIGARIPDLLASARTTVDANAGPLAGTLDSLLDSVGRAVQGGAKPTADQVLGAGSTIADVLGTTTTVATLVFFWTHERARLQRFALAFVPAPRRAGTRQAWNDVEARLGHWVRAQLILMGLMGLATGIAYSVLGLPGALAVALAAALLEAIPILGPLLGAIPALLVAATVRPELLLAVAVVYAVIQLAESNVAVPLVMGNNVGLSPFVVLVAVLFGAVLGGAVGAFLAVPIAASAEIVLERLQARETPVTLESESAPPPDPDPSAGPQEFVLKKA